MNIRGMLSFILESKFFKLLKDFKEVIGLSAFYLAFLSAPLNSQLSVEIGEIDFLVGSIPAIDSCGESRRQVR